MGVAAQKVSQNLPNSGLVVGHSTNLRALSAWIEPKLDPKALQKLEIKNPSLAESGK